MYLFANQAKNSIDHLFCTTAHWASYVVGGITQLKVRILLDFAKSQIAEENSKVCASDL